MRRKLKLCNPLEATSSANLKLSKLSNAPARDDDDDDDDEQAGRRNYTQQVVRLLRLLANRRIKRNLPRMHKHRHLK